MSGLSVLDWAARILIGVLVAGAIGAGAFLLVRLSGADDPQVVAQLIETPTPLAPTDTPAPPTPTATELPPTQPPPTAPPPTDVPPAPTQDTRVAIMDRPTLDQIQLAKDGTYFIADRGDGCTWAEHSRRRSETVGLVVSLFTDCPADFFFHFRPETGDIILVLP